MIHRALFRALLLASLLVGGSGCISIPDDVRADFEPPNGQRPNNFGRVVDGPEGPVVEPDVPTLPPARAEPGS